MSRLPVDNLLGVLGNGASSGGAGMLNMFGSVGDQFAETRRSWGLGRDEEAGLEQQGFGDEAAEMFNMTNAQRMGAFLMTFGVGVMMILMSAMFLPIIVLKPVKFAMSFSLGNILAVFSTIFLVGPKAQLRSMFHPARTGAALVYIGSVMLTLFFAVYGGPLRYILVVLALLVEVVALVWYAASFIPFGRSMIAHLSGYSTWASM